MPENQRFMTTDEVAELLRMPANSVRYWRHVGKGPKSFKVGRRVLYGREDVLAFLSEAMPNPEIVDASDVFAVKWSDEEREWVATCDRFPSLSWLAPSPLEALDGLLRVMA